MNKLKALTLIQVKDFMGKAQNSVNVKNNFLWKLLQLVLLASIGIPATSFSIMGYSSFARLGQPELLITSMYVNSVMLMFFLGIPFVVSVFFFSRDIKFLSTLPVTEDAIIFSKLSTIYIYLSGVSLLFMGPSLIIYGYHNGFSPSYSLLGLLALLSSPFLPLMISAFFVLLTSRFLVNSKNRNLFAIISNVLLLGIIIVIQLGITRHVANPHYLEKVINNQEGLLGLIGLRFPPSIWLTRMVMGSLADTLLFISFNILLFLLIQVLSRLFYRRAILIFSESAYIRGGRLYYRQQKKSWRLIKRNMGIIFGEPTFILNTVLTVLAPVLMVVIFTFTGEFSLQLLKTPQIQPYLVLIFCGLLISPAVISNISATAITREGRSFWETKVLPVSPVENIKYRLIPTLIFNYLGSLILFILSLFLLPLTLEMILIGGFICIITTQFLSIVDIIINIYRPLLNWTNPTAAVKNNLNVIISLGIRVVIALIIYLLYLLFPHLFINYEIVIMGVGVILLVLYFLVKKLLFTYYADLFTEISL